MAVGEKLVTIEEFEAFIARPENRERRFELVNGRIVEKVPTEEHGVIALNIGTELKLYARMRGGRAAVEPRHRIPEDEHNARLPDVAFTSAERALPLVKQGAVPQMPDLAVEIQSPDDSPIELREKAIYYLKNGARMVWLVYPDKRTVEIHTAEDLRVLTAGDTLDGGDVLPGFSLPITEIFNA
jgi:Uma2 family endonuclease